MRKITLFYLIMILIAFSISTIVFFLLDSNFFITSLIIGIFYILIGLLTRTENHYSLMKKGGIIMYDENVKIRKEKEDKGDFDFSNKKYGFGIGIDLVIIGAIVIFLSLVADYLIHLFR